jgi:structural maintenance of chromosome 2
MLMMYAASDFGGIFAELLPGNFAKLQPPDGQDLMDGLEVKVQLGSVWKQSLTELSGGQRSVISNPTQDKKHHIFILSTIL